VAHDRREPLDLNDGDRAMLVLTAAPHTGQRISEPTEQSTRLFTLTNVSPSTCSLDGYPTVALLDEHGVRLPLRYNDGRDQVLTSRSPQRVTSRRSIRRTRRSTRTPAWADRNSEPRGC
jgi:Protein of unknown function (DUF4232)